MTRKEHLQKLPLQKRLQATENIRRRDSSFPFNETLSDECNNMEHVLCFIYEKTKQGHWYWWEIKERYFAV